MTIRRRSQVLSAVALAVFIWARLGLVTTYQRVAVATLYVTASAASTQPATAGTEHAAIVVIEEWPLCPTTP